MSGSATIRVTVIDAAGDIFTADTSITHSVSQKDIFTGATSYMSYGTLLSGNISPRYSVTCQRNTTISGYQIEAGYNGYIGGIDFTHYRTLHATGDGGGSYLNDGSPESPIGIASHTPTNRNDYDIYSDKVFGYTDKQINVTNLIGTYYICFATGWSNANHYVRKLWLT